MKCPMCGFSDFDVETVNVNGLESEKVTCSNCGTLVNKGAKGDNKKMAGQFIKDLQDFKAQNNEDVIIVEMYYCPNCGYERPVETIGRVGRFCPRCGYNLNKITKVKKIT